MSSSPVNATEQPAGIYHCRLVVGNCCRTLTVKKDDKNQLIASYEHAGQQWYFEMGVEFIPASTDINASRWSIVTPFDKDCASKTDASVKDSSN